MLRIESSETGWRRRRGDTRRLLQNRRRTRRTRRPRRNERSQETPQRNQSALLEQKRPRRNPNHHRNPRGFFLHGDTFNRDVLLASHRNLDSDPVRRVVGIPDYASLVEPIPRILRRNSPLAVFHGLRTHTRFGHTLASPACDGIQPLGFIMGLERY